MKNDAWGDPEQCLALQACLQGHADAAEDILRTQRNPRDPRVQFNLGWHAMRHGDLKKGSEMLDAGRSIGCYGTNPPLACAPIWRKDDPSNKTILLRSEGGLGDEIIGARFARLLAERGAKVILSCHPSLASLLSRVKGVTAVVASPVPENGWVHCDAWIPAMSAPHLLDVTYDTLDGSPYLAARADMVQKWKRTIRGKRKIGIRWAGSPKFEHQQFRRFDPKLLWSLADDSDATFYSLQKDEPAIERLPDDSPIVDLGPLLTSWEETAGVIANLDLVITSCTSIAHLAGGMGIPTWVIVPVMPYYVWTYPCGGRASPWYDSVRVFRQETWQKWDAPFQKIREELMEVVHVQA